MKLIAYCLPLVVAFSCGTPKEPVETVVIDPEPVEVVVIEETEPVEVLPVIPEDAVTARYIKGDTPFYAFVEPVNRKHGITTIRFERDNVPPIVLKETYGAELIPLRFAEFENDLLLVNSKLKDPQFNKYYLYRYGNGKWQRLVNGWAIHRSNVSDTLAPIQPSANHPEKFFRYYSVFDLDRESETGYTWKLLSEEVVVNR